MTQKYVGSPFLHSYSHDSGKQLTNDLCPLSRYCLDKCPFIKDFRYNIFWVLYQKSDFGPKREGCMIALL